MSNEFTKQFMEELTELKKSCAKRMRSKSHSDQIIKFIDNLWLEGHSKDLITKAVVYAYGVAEGYAETTVNCYVNIK